MGPVILDLPFRGTWRAEMSPARRVPSHGTHLFGVTYAIDFVAVDGRGRSARSTWRAWLSVEEPETFVGFGRAILAPAAGTVVTVHDGEPDHVGRRSQLALVPYALGQAARVRAGIGAIAGNHVVLAIGPSGPFVALVHLRRGSLGWRPVTWWPSAISSPSAATRATAPSPACTSRSPIRPTGTPRGECRWRSARTAACAPVRS